MVLERKDGVTIQVEVHEGQGTCPLLGIELGNSEVKISIQREPSSSFVHASLVHPQRESETVQPADCTSDAELIGDQLSRLGGSTRYFEIKAVVANAGGVRVAAPHSWQTTVTATTRSSPSTSSPWRQRVCFHLRRGYRARH